MAQHGASLLEIADTLGHRQLRMGQRYAHLNTDSRRLMARIFEGEAVMSPQENRSALEYRQHLCDDFIKGTREQLLDLGIGTGQRHPGDPRANKWVFHVTRWLRLEKVNTPPAWNISRNSR